jgi:hypothetical protein
MNIVVDSKWAILFGILYCMDQVIWASPLKSNNFYELVHSFIVNIKDYFYGNQQQGQGTDKEV